MKYLNILNNSFKEWKEWHEEESDDKIQFISECIFEFTTYDSGISQILTKNMFEVIEAIVNKTTFDYIKDEGKYLNYITMINFPFLQDKLEWGTSIRGAWFDKSEYSDYSFKNRKKKIYKIDNQKIPGPEIEEYIKDLIEFVK